MRIRARTSSASSSFSFGIAVGTKALKCFLASVRVNGVIVLPVYEGTPACPGVNAARGWTAGGGTTEEDSNAAPCGVGGSGIPPALRAGADVTPIGGGVGG